MKYLLSPRRFQAAAAGVITVPALRLMTSPPRISTRAIVADRGADMFWERQLKRIDHGKFPHHYLQPSFTGVIRAMSPDYRQLPFS